MVSEMGRRVAQQGAQTKRSADGTAQEGHGETERGSAAWASGFAEDEVERPATADVRTGTAQMGEQIGVGAASVFEGVGENGKVVEGAFVVERQGECGYGRRSPTGINS